MHEKRYINKDLLTSLLTYLLICSIILFFYIYIQGTLADAWYNEIFKESPYPSQQLYQIEDELSGEAERRQEVLVGDRVQVEAVHGLVTSPVEKQVTVQYRYLDGHRCLEPHRGDSRVHTMGKKYFNAEVVVKEPVLKAKVYYSVTAVTWWSDQLKIV